jgi:hypothetical protein
LLTTKRLQAIFKTVVLGAICAYFLGYNKRFLTGDKKKTTEKFLATAAIFKANSSEIYFFELMGDK